MADKDEKLILSLQVERVSRLTELKSVGSRKPTPGTTEFTVAKPTSPPDKEKK